MKRTVFFIGLTIFIFSKCTNKPDKRIVESKALSTCEDMCETKDKPANLTCKLTTSELQQRKATVLSSLQKQILEKKELETGYAFKFNGTDKVIDELVEFVKTERLCCDFFNFNIAVTGNTAFVWLEISGPKEAKEFIRTELEL